MRFAFPAGKSPIGVAFFCMPVDSLCFVTKLGVLGGTFDPIHYGHLAIAEEARERYALDAVLFVPAGDPPHKPPSQADAEQRFLMTALATADHPQFYVSRIEIDRTGPSYTVETMRQLHAAYPHAALFLIIGADMALTFMSWREPQTILSLARVIAATRPGYSLERLQQMQRQPDAVNLDVMISPGLEISSTELRARASTGRSLRYLTPEPVVEYIVKTGLYR
ncbi:MAG: nicotinate-nucleotide adenylyltransferase [Armatimonadota bacterium]